jgi:hypothetical protein
MEPERPLINHQLSKSEMIDRAEQYLKIHASNSHEWDVILPTKRDANLSVGWRAAPTEGESRGDYVSKILDVYRTT